MEQSTSAAEAAAATQTATRAAADSSFSTAAPSTLARFLARLVASTPAIAGDWYLVTFVNALEKVLRLLWLGLTSCCPPETATYVALQILAWMLAVGFSYPPVAPDGIMTAKQRKYMRRISEGSRYCTSGF